MYNTYYEYKKTLYVINTHKINYFEKTFVFFV